MFPLCVVIILYITITFKSIIEKVLIKPRQQMSEQVFIELDGAEQQL